MLAGRNSSPDYYHAIDLYIYRYTVANHSRISKDSVPDRCVDLNLLGECPRELITTDNYNTTDSYAVTSYSLPNKFVGHNSLCGSSRIGKDTRLVSVYESFDPVTDNTRWALWTGVTLWPSLTLQALRTL